MILRAIVILLIVILILNFFRKYIRPVVKAANDINEREKRRNQTIDYGTDHRPKKQRRNNDDDGEYIEYKEIK
ncbi:MAG: hypothetical protein ACT6QS_03240 [Flavobacteriales bacterium]